MAPGLRDLPRVFPAGSYVADYAVWCSCVALCGFAGLTLVFVALAVLQALLSFWRRHARSLRDAEKKWQGLVYGSACAPGGSVLSADSKRTEDFSSPALGSSAPASISSPSSSVLHVVIVVLGDLARSPRMIYHAQAFAASMSPPPIIHVVAYTPTPVPPSLTSLPLLVIHSLPPFPLEAFRRFFRGPFVLVFLALKLVQQAAALAGALLVLLVMLFFSTVRIEREGEGGTSRSALRRQALLVVQTPPALPTAFVCGVTSRLTGAKMILDWHNFAYTLMFPNRPRNEEGAHGHDSLVRSLQRAAAARAESVSGILASEALCVSKAMQQALQRDWGVRAAVLYDHPNAQIRPIDLAERHAIAMKYMRLPRDTAAATSPVRTAQSCLMGDSHSPAQSVRRRGAQRGSSEGAESRRCTDALPAAAPSATSEGQDRHLSSEDGDVHEEQVFLAFIDDCDEEVSGAIQHVGGSRLIAPSVSQEQPRSPSEDVAAVCEGEQVAPRTHLQRQWAFPASPSGVVKCNSAGARTPQRPAEGVGSTEEATLVSRAWLEHGGKSDDSATGGQRTDATCGRADSSRGCCRVAVEVKRRRPAVLLAATSWTGDEDMDLFLGALKRYDRQREWELRSLCKASQLARRNCGLAGDSGAPQRADDLLPPLLVLISGRGPGKSQWLSKARQSRLRHVAIRTLFAALQDYYRLLAAADVGISVHTSSSGVDLPMKVVDLKGAGVPVCAYEFPAIHELVCDGRDALLFVSAEGLCAKLQQLLRRFPTTFDEAVDLWQHRGLHTIPFATSSSVHCCESKGIPSCRSQADDRTARLGNSARSQPQSRDNEYCRAIPDGANVDGKAGGPQAAALDLLYRS
ncbi:chitobiosyldiphosphodolichol beta-mannosyltransferase [Besnoitia besnoiti]|uniref:Chitobiosyldiphosphodolichol beta-mannosyltransferase n=1 Tax=Besnoitia besnoiti TaxID=94643 RepID=A0A2A9MQU1_BESBE|nr:chitobiosyldiphosphodolichol beta-mannosyltransferase [Besnoitia besnoiti]PFH38717.1 chitobiosyldiphosphodolichol beta-mannosyltransferase [Besnoitia besnoiti]